MGSTVIRTWAFNDGSRWNAIQPSPGRLDESALRGLDATLVECRKRGLRVILALTNYWGEYGGMPQYLAWARRGPQAKSEDSDTGDAFYDDVSANRMYFDYVARIVLRTNSISGVPYRDDPTILAWAPANEPRSRPANGGRAGAVAAWLDRAAAHIKRLDLNHLVAHDAEGFLSPASPNAGAINPYDSSIEGVDWEAEVAVPAVDLACIHVYPDTWLDEARKGTAEAAADFVRAWVRTHAWAARAADKPFAVTEFSRLASRGDRPKFYALVLEELASAVRSGALSGALYWMLAGEGYPDYDGFTTYLKGGADVQPLRDFASFVRQYLANARAQAGAAIAQA